MNRLLGQRVQILNFRKVLKFRNLNDSDTPKQGEVLRRSSTVCFCGMFFVHFSDDAQAFAHCLSLAFARQSAPYKFVRLSN